jgi:hypothetical protein
MKPSDHPDFYRLPPPPGRSRESSIVLDREGRFLHDGVPVTHPGMARAFSTWLSRHPDDGRYILDNGYDWTYVTVEDAPFFVLRVLAATGEGRSATAATAPSIELSDGTFEELDPDRLWVGAQDALYTDVKGGAFQARFTRSAQLGLAEFLVEGEGGAVFFDFAGRRRPIANTPRKA